MKLKNLIYLISTNNFLKSTFKIVKKTFLVLLVIFLTSYFCYSQIKSDLNYESMLLSKQVVPASKLSLGVHGGFSFLEHSSMGLAVGLMADIKVANLSVSPQANYWKVSDDNNFEMAVLLRYHLDSKAIAPYFDLGIGLNFLNKKISPSFTDSFTNLGLDLGGGLEFLDVGTNYNIFIDGKYKIIIKDNGNVSVYTLTGGIKFIL
jgi:preprotein translocase subunit SecD